MEQEGPRAAAGAFVLRGVRGVWGEKGGDTGEVLGHGEKGRGWPWTDVRGIPHWIFTPRVVIHLRGSGRSRQWLWAGELRGPAAVECGVEQGLLFPSEGAEAQSLGFQKLRSHRAGHTWVSYASLTCSSPMVQQLPFQGMGIRWSWRYLPPCLCDP